MLHTKECLAESIIAAVENVRDVEGLSHEGFRAVMAAVVDGKPELLAIADGYLADGTKTCRCNIRECGCYADDTNCPHVAREDEDLTYDPDVPGPYGQPYDSIISRSV